MSVQDGGDEYENYDGEFFENEDSGVDKQPRFATITDIVESLNKPTESKSLSLGFCIESSEVDASAKPALSKSKSQRSPVGKNLETYMAEMELGDDAADDDEEESASDTEDEKYAGATDFEAADTSHHEPTPKQTEPLISDQSNKIQLLERLGYSPRTIMSLKSTQSNEKQIKEVPNNNESPNLSSEKKNAIDFVTAPKLVSSFSESSISQSKKSIAWHSEVLDKKSDSVITSQQSSDVKSLVDGLINSKKEETAKKEEENASRVDALLMELFPERADLFRNSNNRNNGNNLKAPQPQKSKKALGMVARLKGPYGLGVVDSSINEDGSHHSPPGSGNGGGVSADMQLRALKKELKLKDDKLNRITEHSVMMANYMDKLKGEIALLNSKLKDMELQMEAKEARLCEALKQRKKKRAKEETAEPAASLLALEADNTALREREHALLSAVEELSIQNHDLIMKLKDSMQRELELSSKSAAIVSNNVGVAILPSIENGHSGRAHSEPGSSNSNGLVSNDDMTRRHGSKKKKGL
mmetsp:Transcript_28733/g.40967  ORF Transcript_28733/g.40967 Transcript_28733/m.40967 type:complete len:529 (-) Transcript_28733:155-1741(-)